MAFEIRRVSQKTKSKHAFFECLLVVIETQHVIRASHSVYCSALLSCWVVVLLVQTNFAMVLDPPDLRFQSSQAGWVDRRWHHCYSLLD